MTVAKEAPDKCPKCGCTSFTQDPDILDTWFSSALWPFSTLGWPEKTEELDYFYPTDVLVTGYDIIFFWVIRMIFSGFEQMGREPFHTVLFHGLVRDEQGRKMSKSLGNGIDPLEVIDKYGADALRFTLITGNAPGNDLRFSEQRIEASRNFANKLWNASRFIMMNMDGKKITAPKAEELEDADKWILMRLNDTVKEVTENMERFELGIAAAKINTFIWETLCDWYIEMVKPRLYSTEDESSKNAALHTLQKVLIDSLKLLHPFMPFITEEIYCTLKEETGFEGEESIMISSWCAYDPELGYEAEEKEVEIIKEAIRGVRNIRSQMNVAPSKGVEITVVSADAEVRAAFEKGRLFFEKLVNSTGTDIRSEAPEDTADSVSVVTENASIFIPLKELVDIGEETARLEKEKKRLEGELKRSHSMLSNEKFMSKAPAEKIEEEKKKLSGYEKMLNEVEERIKTLKGLR